MKLIQENNKDLRKLKSVLLVISMFNNGYNKVIDGLEFDFEGLDYYFETYDFEILESFCLEKLGY